MLEIYNFVLEIYNINKIAMKKSVITIVISILVLVATILWILNSGPVNWKENLQYIVIMVMVAFGLLVAYRRITSTKRGEPADDELSKKVLQKAAAMSYYISIYLWLLIMYLTDRLKTAADEMFGWGILGMAVTFAACWAFYTLRGIRNE